MDNFILYFKMGLNHVLDFSAYDHILFLIVLSVVYSFNQWKKALWLITFFTIGHSITLALAAYNIINVSINLVEFLIPVTIFATAFMNIIRANKASSGKEQLNLFFALLFGLVHGLGFSNYFRLMIGKEEDKIFPLIEFALGIEVSQIIIVLAILIVAALLQGFFRVSKKDWVLVCSAVVLGITIPMIQERIFW